MTNFVLERWGVCFFVVLVGIFSVLLFPHCDWRKVQFAMLVFYYTYLSLTCIGLFCVLLVAVFSAFLDALVLNLPVSDPDSWFWTKQQIQYSVTYLLHPVPYGYINCFLWFFKAIHIQCWTNVGYRKLFCFFYVAFLLNFLYLFYLFALLFIEAISLTSCIAFTFKHCM